jgi:hypothetical protein
LLLLSLSISFSFRSTAQKPSAAERWLSGLSQIAVAVAGAVVVDGGGGGGAESALAAVRPPFCFALVFRSLGRISVVSGGSGGRKRQQRAPPPSLCNQGRVWALAMAFAMAAAVWPLGTYNQVSDRSDHLKSCSNSSSAKNMVKFLSCFKKRIGYPRSLQNSSTLTQSSGMSYVILTLGNFVYILIWGLGSMSGNRENSK